MTGENALSRHHTEITQIAIRFAVGKFLIDTKKYTGGNSDPYTVLTEYFGDDNDRWEQYEKREREIINFLIQQEQSEVAYVHSNAEQIELAHAFIQKLRKQIKDIANGSNPELSLLRDNIGKCLYTLQAFYSTSNWVEMKGATPYRDFGVPGKNLMKTAGTNIDTCKDCDNSGADASACQNNLLVSDMLTSGYQTGQDVEPPYKSNDDLTVGKCGFGGISDTENGQRTAFGGINKDRLDSLYSPHGFLHTEAYFAARTATYQFLIDPEIGIINELQETVFANVFSLVRKSSYGFAIDETGSMGDNIGEVAQHCKEIVQIVTGTEDEPSNYVLTTFSDPENLTQHVLTTENGILMTDTIYGLIPNVNGGGDCPEYALSGLQLCIDLCDENSNIFVFTDASAKDSAREASVKISAVSKNIKVWPVLTGSCEKRKKREFDRSKRQTGSDVFYRIASATGGKAFTVTGSEIPAVMDEVISTTFSRSTAIIDTFSMNPSKKNITFPVDSTLKSLTVLITGAYSTSDVDLRSTEGTLAKSTNTVFSFESPDTVVVKVNNPVTGLYRLVNSGYNTLVVKITAQTNLDVDFGVFEETSNGHLIPVSGNPIQGRNYTIFVTLYSLPTNASVSSLILTNGNQQKTSVNVLKLESEFESKYVATANFNSESYQVSINGEDGQNNVWTRTSSKNINVVSVRLTASSVPDLYKGTVANISYKLENLGSKADIFIVSITDSRALLNSTRSKTEQVYNISAGTWVYVQFEIELSTIYNTVTFYVSVQTYDTGKILQQDRRSIYISSEVPPKCEIASLQSDCNSSLVNDSCSLVDWSGRATVEFSTQLHSVKGTYGLHIEYNSSLGTSPVTVYVHGDCCVTSAYLTVIDQNSNFARCHFYNDVLFYATDRKPALASAEKIAIGITVGIVIASLVVIVSIAFGMQRCVIKPVIDTARISDVNIKAAKDFPLQTEKSSKMRFHENFSSLK